MGTTRTKKKREPATVTVATLIASVAVAFAVGVKLMSLSIHNKEEPVVEAPADPGFMCSNLATGRQMILVTESELLRPNVLYFVGVDPLNQQQVIAVPRLPTLVCRQRSLQ